jgi:hypothetical protein
LDDVKVLASEWCEQARRSSESPAKLGADSLAVQLELIGDGLRLRRRLDGVGLVEASAAGRDEVVRLLTRLQQSAAAAAGDLAPGMRRSAAGAARVRDWLSEARQAVRDRSAEVERDPLRQAMAIDGLRADLEWLSVAIALEDGETPPPLSAWLGVELDRLRGWLATSAEHGVDPREAQLRDGSERIQAVILGGRIRHELAQPLAGLSPDALWARRFRLSRLEAQASELEETGSTRQSGMAIDQGDGPGAWRKELRSRRDELAQIADERQLQLELSKRGRSAERVEQVAFDEAGETIAFLEDMPLRLSVTRLGILRTDLERLLGSCRRWSREIDHHDAGPPSRSDAEIDHEPGGQSESAAQLMRQRTRRIDRLARQVRGEWQEKLLALRMDSLFGRRLVALLENSVLVLIFVLVGLIAAEAMLERSSPSGLSAGQHEFFAWADLAVCSVFLFEFAVKLTLAPHRLKYFLRHVLVDLVPSVPFGFFAHMIELDQLGEAIQSGSWSSPLFRFFRLGRVALRFIRVAMPVARLARVGLILLRLSDRLVHRLAGLLNRNILLFEPAHTQKAESSDRHRLVSLRGELEQARTAIESRLDREQRRLLAERILSDLQCRMDCCPATQIAAAAGEHFAREIPVERVVDRLIMMTPERLVDRTGPAFVVAVDRYLRLLDLPLIRRLPGMRNLVALRQKSPADAVALAANYLGHLIQRGLNLVYFLADLHGTLSPPIFLDRLGATIVNATRVPAKRLLWLGSVFLVLFLVVNAVGFLEPLRGAVDKVQTLLGWPVIILGGICLVFWLLGSWFRKIANQSADFCERVVEAQFATHTKSLKERRREQDAQFLGERVIDPELRLRAADDRIADPGCAQTDPDGDGDQRGGSWFENRELAFLRNVRLLYQDYLDGSPLHRSDTRASVQLMGNLALGNLRRSHLGHLLREGRAIDRLDLSRSGGLFGGPYLWFNYITRVLVQETALLILDYNGHAVPVDRLACSPAAVRRRFQTWVADRLKIDAAEVWLPETMTTEDALLPDRPAPEPNRARSAMPAAARSAGSTRREAGLFLETVEFTAVDFLSDDPERIEEIHARFGPQVAELVRRDRQQNVRRAFRSFPLHELPLAVRTVNPYTLYETYLGGGRIVFLPILVASGLGRALSLAVRSIYRVVQEILHPQVDRERVIPPDTYWSALRKIHRMRKPIFMGSLWLRARFDVEYLGVPLPTAPPGIACQSLMEVDLDYIGATRQDRIIAERVRLQHQKRLEWVALWLDRFGWSFDALPDYLAREIPYLGNRGGEALRALIAACILDHNDIATLALSIEGLKRVLAHAGDLREDPGKLPAGLPDPIVNLRALWHPVHRCRRPISELFTLPCFPAYDLVQRRRVLRYLRGHRRAVKGWIKVVLGQGARDPWAVVQARMRDVLLHTDLWSDQILVLRAVQSLTMLDLQHNCELVWSLGGYTRPEPGGSEPDAQPPRSPQLHEASALTASS